ncbi:DNA repair protein RecO [Candidatus Saccharibacteria bacterium]|nr:MAG: DNA repair protein RecO [Candidatus Saccharibacteria bacterium]
MNQFKTKAIILRRTPFGEADRIMQLLTPDHGKVSAIAKGVRRGKSKLAGGLELFAVCDVTLLKGKSEILTMTSARIETFYGSIMRDYDRLQFGYECIKEVSRASETAPEPEFYELLRQSFDYLNDGAIALPLIEIWFRLQLSILLGQGLNVTTGEQNQRLSADKRYDFDVSDMLFVEREAGRFTADHIKLLRLLTTKNPRVVSHVGGIQSLLEECLWVSRVVSGA